MGRFLGGEHRGRTDERQLAGALPKNDWISANCSLLNSTCDSRGRTKRYRDSVKKLRAGLEMTQPSYNRPIKNLMELFVD